MLKTTSAPVGGEDRQRDQSPNDRSEADQLLVQQFGKGPRVSPDFACIHHAIAAQAGLQPQGIAARHGEAHITFAELEQQAEQLAALLTQHGVGAGANVALFLQRSIPMLVGILAVLKVGAAYVPQDVGISSEAQLRHVVATAETRVILTLSHLQHLVPVPAGHVCICIDDFLREAKQHVGQPIAGQAAQPAPTDSAPDTRRCFVLFTSGTTGMPNGVQVTHRNVCNILLTDPGRLGMRPGIKVSQILNIAFDMAAWEILGSLANGATLLIRGPDIAETAQQANVIIATPSILSRIDPSLCAQVKVVAVAGEPCPHPLADLWSSFCTFYNGCGPTETTIVNTMQRYPGAGHTLTIGKPTPNNTVYVLDAHGQRCSIGETGEMWAGGLCVTAGYLANEALNRERYLPDPFAEQGAMMFRTRDLGRWTPNGELEHLGRVDDQVKIKGFRVELDSVSAVLESEPTLQRAVTLKVDHNTLFAFAIPASANVALAAHKVKSTLPYYCMPAAVIALDKFPVTDRGKVDKQRLLTLAQAHLAQLAQNSDQPQQAERSA